MSARYLVRLDDLCPTMNWDAWTGIEKLLDRTGIRPLLAVIPDNQDTTLRITSARPDFWDRVREWQARGWNIGVHGYQHRYVARDRGIYGRTDRSEFAGLSVAEQRDKIQSSLSIFAKERVTPEAWIAPNHSFDRTTLAVLKEAGLRVISDGLSLYPFVDEDDMMWIPQQLWKFRPRRVGVWTVCVHFNHWTIADLEEFSNAAELYGSRITDFASLLGEFGGRSPSVLDRSFRVQRRAEVAVLTRFRRWRGTA